MIDGLIYWTLIDSCSPKLSSSSSSSSSSSLRVVNSSSSLAFYFPAVFSSISSAAGYGSVSRGNRKFLWELGSIQLITDHSLNDNRLQPQAHLIVGFFGGWGDCEERAEAHYVWESAAFQQVRRIFRERKLAPFIGKQGNVKCSC